MVYGSIADIFFQWEYMGVFDFILPFLLVFVIVYGIVSAIHIFGDNKGVHVVIAFVIGLMSLRYQYFFSSFISELFPRLAIGLAMILAIMILVGMFIAKNQWKYWFYGLGAIAAFIAIIVIYQAFKRTGLLYGWGISSETVGFVILGLLVVAVIIAIAAGKSETREGKGQYLVPITQE